MYNNSLGDSNQLYLSIDVNSNEQAFEQYCHRSLHNFSELCSY